MLWGVCQLAWNGLILAHHSPQILRQRVHFVHAPQQTASGILRQQTFANQCQVKCLKLSSSLGQGPWFDPSQRHCDIRNGIACLVRRMEQAEPGLVKLSSHLLQGLAMPTV